MTNINESQNFYWHESAGARILLPSQLSVEWPFPDLCTKPKKDLLSIFVTITSNENQRMAFEGLIRGPHPSSNALMIIDILRQRESDPSLRGLELISETRIVETGFTSYSWLRVLYLDESSGAIACFDVRGTGLFRDAEPMWQKVMDSFSWNGDKAEVLKFDGDEAVHQARYSKKKRKRTKTASSPRLPSPLSYLQPVMDELMSLPPEEVNEDLDISLLFQLLEQRIKGLSLAKAESRLTTDRKKLKAWMEKDRDHRCVVEFVLPIMQEFEFSLGE